MEVEEETMQVEKAIAQFQYSIPKKVANGPIGPYICVSAEEGARPFHAGSFFLHFLFFFLHHKLDQVTILPSPSSPMQALVPCITSAEFIVTWRISTAVGVINIKELRLEVQCEEGEC